MHSAMLLSFLQVTAFVASALAATVLPPVARRDVSLQARAPSALKGPKFVIYTDEYINSDTGLPKASQLKGYNVLILAFLLVDGPADQAKQWTMLSPGQRQELLDDYHAHGIKLMVSSFGSTETPTSDGADPTSMGHKHADFVKKWKLDGIDVDYEDMPAMNRQDGSAENWLIKYTQALRDDLPAGDYLLTHAPVAPWFSEASYNSHAYAKVDQVVGDLIDFYNLQFYNQGTDEYTDCQGLLHKSKAFPKTSVFEIHETLGIPLSKLVVGKPSQAYQASNGFMSTSELQACIVQAAGNGWFAGVMFWEFTTKDVTGALLGGMVNALGGGGGAPVPPVIPHSTTVDSGPTSTKTSESSTPTQAEPTNAPPPPPSSNANPHPHAQGCNGAKPWSSTTIYDGGSQVTTAQYVTYDGSVWANKWWTQNDVPGEGGDADPWEKVTSCSSKRDVPEIVANVSKRMHRKRMSRIAHHESS